MPCRYIERQRISDDEVVGAGGVVAPQAVAMGYGRTPSSTFTV